ncbi:MAG: PAS domain S-box protein [Dehalococcoidales bacterium]
MPSKQDKANIESKQKPPEESYHALIKLGSDMGQAVVMLRNVNGIEGKQVFISNMWAGITGYSRSELLGTSFFDLVKEEDRQASIERYRKRMSGKPVPGKFYLSIRCKSGEDAHLELSSAVSASDGSATNIMFIRDVSSQVVSEAKAREFEEQFQTIIDLASDTGEAIVILQTIDGVEGRYVFVNDLWSDITGYSKEELLDMSAFDLIAPEHKQASRNRYRAVLAGKVQPKLFEGAIITKSGELVPVELSIAPINYHRIPSAIVHLRDITARKEAEKVLLEEKNRYITLFDNAPIVMVEADFSRTKKVFDKLKKAGLSDFDSYFEENPEMVHKCYFEKATMVSNPATINQKEAQGMTKLGKFLEDALANKSDYWRSIKDNLVALAQGKTTISGIKQSITIKGNLKTVQQHLVVAPGYEDTLSKVFLYYIDLTEVKEKERELQKYQHHLEKLVKERTLQLENATEEVQTMLKQEHKTRNKLEEELEKRILFTRLIVHELKTPLTPMLVASEVLHHGLTGSKEKVVARNLYDGAVALNRRIDELLDIARGELKMLQLKKEPVNMIDLINNAIEKMSYEFMARKQVFTSNLNITEACIDADCKRMEQVLVNLLDNASKFSPDKSRIEITAHNTTDNIIVEIADAGPGIPVTDREKIFEPYYSLKGHFRPHSGIGIGLSLAKMLIELHGGVIGVRSGRSQGSVFYFTIPCSGCNKL